MEMLVLDQTRPEIGLPVVKVVVPGLRHFWAPLRAGPAVRRAGAAGLAGAADPRGAAQSRPDVFVSEG